jgi:hypothetical protein
MFAVLPTQTNPSGYKSFRWSALQDVAALDEEGVRKIWSESHVSEGEHPVPVFGSVYESRVSLYFVTRLRL